MTDNNQKKLDFSHLLLTIGGAFVGAWYVKNEIEEWKKSRAEKDDPQSVEEVCTEMAELLGQWQPDEDCETEDDFTQSLANYLNDNSDWEIEIYPKTPEGQPDILIGDLLVIELKLNPKKTERDRLVGQCAGYSRLWVTWALIIGGTPNRIGRLENLLEDKGLERILVWNYS